MKWQREHAFAKDLEAVCKKATKKGLERVSKVAVEDAAQCYKCVTAMLDRQFRKSKGKAKISTLYTVSAILRRSRKQQGGKDKYAERFAPLLRSIIETFRSESDEVQAKVSKVIKLWGKEEVFSGSILNEVKGILNSSAEATSTRVKVKPAVSGSSSMSLSEPSAGSAEGLGARFRGQTVWPVVSTAVHDMRGVELSSHTTGLPPPPSYPPLSVSATDKDMYDPFSEALSAAPERLPPVAHQLSEPASLSNHQFGSRTGRWGQSPRVFGARPSFALPSEQLQPPVQSRSFQAPVHSQPTLGVLPHQPPPPPVNHYSTAPAPPPYHLQAVGGSVGNVASVAQNIPFNFPLPPTALPPPRPVGGAHFARPTNEHLPPPPPLPPGGLNHLSIPTTTYTITPPRARRSTRWSSPEKHGDTLADASAAAPEVLPPPPPNPPSHVLPSAAHGHFQPPLPPRSPPSSPPLPPLSPPPPSSPPPPLSPPPPPPPIGAVAAQNGPPASGGTVDPFSVALNTPAVTNASPTSASSMPSAEPTGNAPEANARVPSPVQGGDAFADRLLVT